MKYILLFTGIWGLGACAVPPEPHPLWGAWEMEAIHWIFPDTTRSIHAAQPGLLMISPTRYSLLWTPTPLPRTPFVHLTAPTEAEVQAAFNSIVFNAGTFTLTDSLLTTQADIARVPGFEGGVQVFTYLITADTLRLTRFDETYPDGTKPTWAGHMKTQFVMTRASHP